MVNGFPTEASIGGRSLGTAPSQSGRGEHLDEAGDRGESRVVVSARGLNKRPRAAAAMTISPAAPRGLETNGSNRWI